MSDYDLYWIDEPDSEHVPKAREPEPPPPIIFFEDGQIVGERIAPLDDPWWDARALSLCARLRKFDAVDFADDPAAKVVEGALRIYLHLEPDETLMAVVDPSWGAKPARGCALTTRRVYFAGPFIPGAEARSFARKGEGPHPPFLRSIPYENLAEVGPDGVLRERDAPSCVPACGRIDLGPKHDNVRQVVCQTLTALAKAAQAEPAPEPINDTGPDTRTLRSLSSAARRTDEIRPTQGGFRRFGDALKATSPRIMAVPLLAMINIAVFLVMIASGVSPIEPDAATAYEWGASNGVGVLVENEPWRLLTCTFLHYGLAHLAVNMVFLYLFGPKVERLFGFWPFLGLYLLAGLSGAVASLWYHPLVTGAGASGALYGLVGALFGCIGGRRDIPPRAILSLFPKGLWLYLAIDTTLGLFIPRIDGAAHIGGLVGGFVCGLILNRPWPPSRSRGVGLKRPIGFVVLAAGLLSIFLAIRGDLRNFVESDPEMIKVRRTEKGIRDYNEFTNSFAPLTQAFDDSTDAFNGIVTRFNAREEDGETAAKHLASVQEQVEANARKIAAIDVKEPELRMAKEDMLNAHESLTEAMRLLARFAREGNVDLAESKYKESLDKMEQKTNSYVARLNTFAKDRSIELDDPGED